MKKYLFTFFLCLIINTTEALPSAFNASYKISARGLTIGSMKASLVYMGNQYKYHKSSKATGLASFLSGDKITDNVEGTFKGETLQPLTYLFSHKSKRKDIQDTIRFQSPTRVTEHYKKKSYKLDVPTGTLDRSSMELALARDIRFGKKQFSYSVIDSGKQKSYVFVYSGNEKITVPAGRYNCKKFVIQRKEKNRKTTLWLAAETDYMPVKIEHIEKGESIVTQLSNFKASLTN